MNCYGIELFTTHPYVEYDRLLAQKNICYEHHNS